MNLRGSWRLRSKKQKRQSLCNVDVGLQQMAFATVQGIFFRAVQRLCPCQDTCHACHACRAAVPLQVMKDSESRQHQLAAKVSKPPGSAPAGGSGVLGDLAEQGGGGKAKKGASGGVSEFGFKGYGLRNCSSTMTPRR